MYINLLLKRGTIVKNIKCIDKVYFMTSANASVVLTLCQGVTSSAASMIILLIPRAGGYHYKPCMVFAPLRQNVIKCINHQLTMYQHCLFIKNVNDKKAIRYLLKDQRFDTIVCSLTRRKASSCPLQAYNNRTRGKLISNNTESLNNIVVFQFQKQLLVLYLSSLNNLYYKKFI